jgi:hypothetical protein
MISYLCVGLGVFLSIYVVNLANPVADLGFWEGIIAFLTTIFGWPITLFANALKALQVREEGVYTEKLMSELMEKMHSVDEEEVQKLLAQLDEDEENKQ